MKLDLSKQKTFHCHLVVEPTKLADYMTKEDLGVGIYLRATDKAAKIPTYPVTLKSTAQIEETKEAGKVSYYKTSNIPTIFIPANKVSEFVEYTSDKVPESTLKKKPGRPAKTAAEASKVEAPKKKQGRPPKAVSAEVVKSSEPKKKPGRPAKEKRATLEATAVHKKKPGRPKKSQDLVVNTEEVAEVVVAAEAQPKKKQGRPPKALSAEVVKSSEPKKKPGRPAKIKEQNVSIGASATSLLAAEPVHKEKAKRHRRTKIEMLAAKAEKVKSKTKKAQKADVDTVVVEEEEFSVAPTIGLSSGAVTPKKRGRPAKNDVLKKVVEKADTKEQAIACEAPKKRGRPAKAKEAVIESVPKKQLGRPKKEASALEQLNQLAEKKRPGRPKKVVEPEGSSICQKSTQTTEVTFVKTPHSDVEEHNVLLKSEDFVGEQEVREKMTKSNDKNDPIWDSIQTLLQMEYLQRDLYEAYDYLIFGAAGESIRSHLRTHLEEEMQHIQILQRYLVGAGRIPTLDRLPIPSLDFVDLKNVLKSDFEHEKKTVEAYAATIRKIGDQASDPTLISLRVDLEGILANEQEHVHDLQRWLTTPMNVSVATIRSTLKVASLVEAKARMTQEMQVLRVQIGENIKKTGEPGPAMVRFHKLNENTKQINETILHAKH